MTASHQCDLTGSVGWVKIQCPCGGLISDSTDYLRDKARLIADQDWLYALDGGRDRMWSLSRTIWQCSDCCRLHIDDRDSQLHCFAPTGIPPTELLGSKFGDNYRRETHEYDWNSRHFDRNGHRLIVETLHTAQLAKDRRPLIRSLLDDAFGSGFSDDDWNNSLGGMHAVIWSDDTLVGHGSVVSRRMLNAGHTLRAGYIEAVAVRDGYRRLGVGGMLMLELEHIIDDAYDIGALSASNQAKKFYRSRPGWMRWQGRSFALTPRGIERTAAEDKSIHIYPTAAVTIDVSGDLTCDWRDGDVW